MTSNQITERPQILSWGIVLMAAISALCLFVLLLALVAVPVFFGIGVAESRGDDAAAIFFVGLFVEFVLGALALLKLVSLYACKRAWERSRTWLIVLMILAGMWVFSSGPVGILVAGLTIVGGIQALERSPAPAREENSESPPAPAASGSA